MQSQSDQEQSRQDILELLKARNNLQSEDFEDDDPSLASSDFKEPSQNQMDILKDTPQEEEGGS